MSHWKLALSAAAVALLLESSQLARAPQQAPHTYGFQVVKAYPHDSSAFTQGLIYANGYLYESTGLTGRSTLRRVDLETGRVLQRYTLLPEFFAEGLTEWRSNLIQLTYRSQTAFIYDRSSLIPKGSFAYSGEGWGLTQDGKKLIMSDGSSMLRFLDPETFEEIGALTVRSEGSPVTDLNELEYVRGEIYANVWHTDRIARISPSSGQVLGWIELRNLMKPEDIPPSDMAKEAVLNGIAYDAAGGRLFVTGKLWPKLFEIKLIER